MRLRLDFLRGVFYLELAKNFHTIPAKSAPAIGAAQNTQTWESAAVSAKSAAAVLRAGFTEVLDTGIEIR